MGIEWEYNGIESSNMEILGDFIIKNIDLSNLHMGGIGKEIVQKISTWYCTVGF